ncbi:hypothetical protein [Sphaerospermopsis aphanizomenoides]|nr:hypothetical protein [Sphaerospermopsis aphanizomenoides]
MDFNKCRQIELYLATRILEQMIGDWGLGTGDWGLVTGDWGQVTGDWE